MQAVERKLVGSSLLAGPVLFALGDLVRRLIENGHQDAAGITAAVATHPTMWAGAGLLSWFGCLLFALGAARTGALVSGRGRGLVSIGGLLLAVGGVAGVGHAIGYFAEYDAYARSGQDGALVGRLVDAGEASPVAIVGILVFMAGVVVGPVLLSTGLRRAGAVPVWVPFAAVVFAVAGGTGGTVAGAVGVVAALVTFAPIALLAAGVRAPRLTGAAPAST